MRDIIKCDIFHKSDDSYKWADNIREQQNFPNCSGVYLMLTISLRLWWVWHHAAELSLLNQEVIPLLYPKPLNGNHHHLGCNSFPGETAPSIGWACAEPSLWLQVWAQSDILALWEGKAELTAHVWAGWHFPDAAIHHKLCLMTKMGRSWSSKIQFFFVSKQDVD